MARKKASVSRLSGVQQAAKSWTNGNDSRNEHESAAGSPGGYKSGDQEHLNGLALTSCPTEEDADLHSVVNDDLNGNWIFEKYPQQINLASSNFHSKCSCIMGEFRLKFSNSDTEKIQELYNNSTNTSLKLRWNSQEQDVQNSEETLMCIMSGKRQLESKTPKKKWQNCQIRFRCSVEFSGVTNPKSGRFLESLKNCHSTFLWGFKELKENWFIVTIGLRRQSSQLGTDAIFASNKNPKSIRNVMAYCLPKQLPFLACEDQTRPSNTLTSKENLEEFFAQVKSCQKSQMSRTCDSESKDPQHSDLVPKLRPYQRHAVGWMYRRETSLENNLTYGHEFVKEHFFPIAPPTGDQLLYAPAVGAFIQPENIRNPVQLPGGILADEMGLGKTVEMIALMLMHPRKEEESPEKSGRISPQNATTSCDNLEEIGDLLSDLISSVVGIVEGRQALNQIGSPAKGKRARTLYFSDNLEQPNRKKMKNRRLTEVQCISCEIWISREMVGWNLFDSDDARFTCPKCCVQMDATPGKATLVVAPSTILYQWYEELKRHVGGRHQLKIAIYRGVSVDGFQHPQYMAQCDIVLCSYETLRSELFFVYLADFYKNLNLRNPKRYQSAPSPLTAVEWWRICLDEAQMVENTATKAAAMCLELKAVNRWCVSGTPIQKSVDEFHGLLTFLGIEPYYAKPWWDSVLWEPYLNGHPLPLVQVLSRCLWRNTKAQVKDQLDLPEKTDKICWLKFSPIEEQFYRQTADSCSAATRRVVAQYEEQEILELKLSELNRQAVAQLMRPLLSLRRCTVHPAVRKNGNLALTGINRNLTQAELLDEMTRKTKRDCEEAHRRVVLAFNVVKEEFKTSAGLAGLAWLERDFVLAAESYRRALRSIKEHETMDKFRTDPLQQIHAMHNLAQLLDQNRDVIPPTCMDDQLIEMIAQRKARYLTEVDLSFKAAANKLQTAIGKRSEAIKKLRKVEGWLAEVCNMTSRFGMDGDFVVFIRDYLNAKRPDGTNFAFRNCTGLAYQVDVKMRVLMEGRDHLAQAVKEIENLNFDSVDFVDSVALCHLRPYGGLENVTKNCHLCRTEALIREYESLLYCFADATGVATERVAMEDESGNLKLGVALFGAGQRGNYSDSDLELVVKAVVSYVRGRQVKFGRDLLAAGCTHLALFDVLKSEFTALRNVYKSGGEFVHKMDEVRMAVERLRYRSSDEEGILRALEGNRAATNIPLNAIIPAEIPQQRADFVATQADGERALGRAMGKLNYLDNLRRMHLDPTAGNMEECPVCTNRLGHHWAVLICSHYFCTQCIAILSKQHFGGGVDRVRCAVCRQMTNRANVTYVMSGPWNDKDSTDNADATVLFNGSYSTKVEAVVRRLLVIKRREPMAKALVFSSWIDVLAIVSHALNENGLQHRLLGRTGRSKQKDVADFRLDPDISVLLLPVSSGANGLNLVEASHVLLVEPLLNTAAEKQAVGRIERIGQRHATTVHRFLVRGSIEERLYDACDQERCEEASHSKNDNLNLLESNIADSWTIAHLAQLVTNSR